MSNLLKSKFLLGVMIVAVMAVGFVAVGANKAAADCSLTTTLRVGSRGVEVQCLQSVVGATADGSFGPLTKASVMAWQSSHGLVADGVVGAKSRAVFNALGSSASFAPAGCTSASGFSPSTGGACYAVSSPSANSFAPAGCTSASGFSPSTGGACYAVVSNTSLPAGCTSTSGFSPQTGASCATGVVNNQTGPITVALAIDNPASGSFIYPASGVQFAKFTFSGTGTVTSVKLMRTGVSASTTLQNVYLYDGATRLTDGASISSDNTVTFNAPNGLFTVAGSKTITVVADSLAAGGYSLGFTLVGYTANSTASVVSVAGNLMYGASATLSKATLTSALGSGATDAGVDITVWQSTATIDLRDVLLKSLALRQIGNIASADIGNFKLYVDGVLVSTVPTLDANGYVTFATSTVLKTGARTLKVTADILGGAARTVQFSLRGAYDLLTTDTQYNANGTTSATFPFGPASFLLNSGNLTVVKAAASRSGNITKGGSDQSVATYTFTAYGEAVKVETLRVGFLQTGGGASTVSLRNVRVLVNGAQVGSTTTVPAELSFVADSGTQFTTNFIVYPGTPATVEIRSDVFDNEGTDEITAGTTTAIQADLIQATGNGVPQVSITATNVPSANKLGNNLTISSGTMALTLTSSYNNRSVAVPTNAYKIGSYQLTGSSTEAINLNTIYVGWQGGDSITPSADLSDLYVVYGGTMSPVKGTVAGATGAVSNANSWSINRTLAINETMPIDVYATLASTVLTSNIMSTLAVAGTTASSGIAVYADSTANTVLDSGFLGQTITGAAGTLVLSNDASMALPSIVDDSGTVVSLTSKFVAATDSYTVTDMTVLVSNASAVATVTLKDHTTHAVIGAAKPGATSVTWSGLSMPVLANQTVQVDVELALSPVGVGAGTTGSLLQTQISAYTARNSAGATGIGTTGTSTGNVIYVYHAIPTVSLLTIPTSALVFGTNTLAKFSINTNGTGTIAWNRMILNISKISGTGVILANGAAFTLWNADSGTQVLGTMTVRDSANAATCLAALALCRLQFVPTNEEQISGARSYLLKASVTGAVVANDYISTTFSSLPSVFAASTDYPTVAAAGSFAETYAGYGSAASFIWSDVSAAGHATTVSTDWTNDYLVRSLPLDSQTLTK